jgi:hypothetical protein
VAVHEGAVLSPADALKEYGEDVLETKQRGLHLVVQSETGMSERSDEQRAKLEMVQQRLAPMPGDERQLWLGITLGAADPSAADERATDSLTKEAPDHYDPSIKICRLRLRLSYHRRSCDLDLNFL